jgi:outer membrane biosynthesis protein TonB
VVKTIRIDPEEAKEIMCNLAGWRYRYDWTTVVLGALRDAVQARRLEMAEVPKLYQQIADAKDLELLPKEPFDLGEPEPEPEPVQVAEPEPVQVAEPEPVQVAEPEPVQVAEPEPVQVAEPEPVQVAEPEPVQVAEPTKALAKAKAKAKAKPTSTKAKPTSTKAKPTSTKAKPTSTKSAKPAPSKNGAAKKGSKK